MTVLRSPCFAADPVLEACLSGHATLEEGMAGSAVAKVQQALMEMGYILREFGPDGVFGKETGEAVVAFNRDIGLAATGTLASRAMGALDDRFAGGRSGSADEPAGRAATPLRGLSPG